MHPLHPLIALRLARELAASHIEEARTARRRRPVAGAPDVRRGRSGPAVRAQAAPVGRTL
ncbi:MAG: hypothetical protein K6V73_09905 [Firmicutes bacterium]|nr:hypothetical protein [Bacillota bacterium]